ncbi:MAG: hypothetical protein WC799_20945 [Desulfobacteraceae bacterium]|jgi:hypothetical protein
MVYILGFIVLISSLPAWLDEYYFPNYFFSHTHLKPEYFFGICAVCIVFLIKAKLTKLTLVYALLLTGFFIPQILGKTMARAFYVLVNDNLIAHKKLTNVYGEKYWFIQHIKTLIPQNSTILIPPQNLSWRHTGDFFLMQAWLYPRKVITATYVSDLNPNLLFKFDYILISSETNLNLAITWPDFKIPASKIIIYNWENHSSQELNNIDYDPKFWLDKKPWGLLVPKKK